MKKKNLYIFLFILVLICVLVGMIIKSVNDSNNYNLNLVEKNWIDKNKSKIFSIDVPSEVMYFSKDGSGVLFNYFEYIKNNTKLQIEPIVYNVNNITNTYFHIEKKAIDSKISKNDFILFEDNYVLVGKTQDKITNLSILNDKRIGVVSDDLDKVSTYVDFKDKVNLVTYLNIEEMISSIKNEDLDYIIIPRNEYYNSFNYDTSHSVAYELSEYKNVYILTINTGYKRLDSILKKMLYKYRKEEFLKDYNQFLFEDYYLKNNISDAIKTDFLSKEYIYGYVSNAPYEISKNTKFIGYNKTFLNNYSDFTNTTIKYKRYSNINELSRALENKKIDIAFNYYNFRNIKSNYVYTNSIYESKYLILKKQNNTNIFINSLKSLKSVKVDMLNTKLSKYIGKNSLSNINTHEKMSILNRNINNDSVVILDKNIYDIYKNSVFKKYICLYDGIDNSEKGFILVDSKVNNLFNNSLIFYINSFNHEKFYNIAHKEYVQNTDNTKLILIVIGILLSVLAVSLLFIKKMIKPHKVSKKEDALRYVDDLTLVKNRNYLNKNFKKWENNIIYPQSIIIVNLNNIRHINDVYGHDEGDKLIKLAANVLIKNQLEQSDIVRTDGNEFLIYIIGYSETKIISYMRKLYNELKELPYGFGASLGYSMIVDDVKTIDDAINEAILEIRTNKKLQSDK